MSDDKYREFFTRIRSYTPEELEFWGRRVNHFMRCVTFGAERPRYLKWEPCILEEEGYTQIRSRDGFSLIDDQWLFDSSRESARKFPLSEGGEVLQALAMTEHEGKFMHMRHHRNLVTAVLHHVLVDIAAMIHSDLVPLYEWRTGQKCHVLYVATRGLLEDAVCDHEASEGLAMALGVLGVSQRVSALICQYRTAIAKYI